MRSWQLFIRHAHRSTFDSDLDNGLSEKGFGQCDELVAYLGKQGLLKSLENIYASPKLRCVETAQAVADACDLVVKVDTLLDERGPESGSDFRKKVEQFVQKTRDMTKVCFVSHGDFLPLVAKIYGFPGVEIRKGDLFLLEDGKIRQINPLNSSGKPS